MRTKTPFYVSVILQILLLASCCAWPGVCDDDTNQHESTHTIRAISYNVQFLPGVAALANKRPHAEYRAQQLGRLLSEFDIVGLNEVFQDDPRDTILNGLRDAWGDQFGVIEGPAPDQPGRFNGGLALATRLPIVSSHEIVYQNYSRPEDFGVRADGYAAKGVLHARLKRSATSAETDCIDVFVTHMEARDDSLRPLQYAEMATFIRKHSDPNCPAIIMGDFNTRGGLQYRNNQKSQYRQLITQLTSALPDHQLQDLWPAKHGDLLGGTSEQESADIGKRIDYIMLAIPAAAADMMSCTNIRVNPYLDAKTVALSDHSAVEAELKWKAPHEQPSGAGQSAVDHPVPFVAGFERFARHGLMASESAGRLLASELSCTACHQATDAGLKPKAGPDLTSVGNRVTKSWLQDFLQDPHRAKPGTTMPNVLHAVPPDERGETLRQLVAFLESLQRPYTEIKGTGAVPVPHEFWKQGKPNEGRRLFHRIGCVACHPADPTYETVRTKPTPLDNMLEQLDEDELKELGLDAAARRVPSTPLGRPATKYTAQSLTRFLLDPHAVRPTGRMPNFGLGVVEAADIAAWLLAGNDSGTDQVLQDNATASESDIAAGRQHFSELGCANCHAAGIKAPATALTPWENLNFDAEENCLNQPTHRLPWFALDADQVSSLRAAIIDAGQPLKNPSSEVSATLARFNCYACHARDQLGGVGRYRKRFFETYGQIDIGDEGRLPPQLTSVGFKLHPRHIQAAIAGKSRHRPYMSIRMPAFPAGIAAQVAEEMSQQDLRSSAPRTEPVDDAPKIQHDAGRRLLDIGCVQCHPLAGENLPGVVGVDLGDVAERVRPEWFHAFLLNPGELKPGTRMPSFFPRGKSQSTAILDGDASRQISAMYTYLKDSKRLPLPAKLQEARSASYELSAEDSPVLLRTFMKQAGTHALAVALPGHVNFAFDTQSGSLAYLWKGAFLDAQGTWFMRFVPDAEPLGAPGHVLPSGPLLAELPAVSDVWPHEHPDITGRQRTAGFDGYRVDAAGIPEFLYRAADCEVADRLALTSSGILRRRLTLTSSKRRQVWFRAAVAAELDHDTTECRTEDGLTIRVVGLSTTGGTVVKQNDKSEWRIPVLVDGTVTLEIDYEW